MDKKDVVYIYTMEYYSAIKENEIMSFAETWMDLDIITLKWSQTEKDKYHMLSLCGIFFLIIKRTYLQNRNRSTNIENKLMATKGEAEGWSGNLELTELH